jgi:hypothetical protein
VNALQRDALLSQAAEAMGQRARALLIEYHKACLASATTALITAPLDMVPGLQAQAQVHDGILKALTAGA